MSAIQRSSKTDSTKYSYGTETAPNQSISEGLNPELQLGGGVYRSTLPTYSDGENTIIHFNSKGGLLVDTTTGAVGVSTGTSTAVTCGATSVTVLAASATRKFATIVNDSDETIYLKYGSGATLNSGIRLNAHGGAHNICACNLYTGIITGIATNATKKLTVTSG